MVRQPPLRQDSAPRQRNLEGGSQVDHGRDARRDELVSIVRRDERKIIGPHDEPGSDPAAGDGDSREVTHVYGRTEGEFGGERSHFNPS